MNLLYSWQRLMAKLHSPANMTVRNLAGTSWSLPSLLSCAPISLSSQLDKEKYVPLLDQGR